MSLRSRTLPRSSGPKELTLARTWAPVTPDSDRISTGWPCACEGPAQGLGAADDVGVGRVAGGADARQVALHVDGEDGDARGRELAREKLERLGLARAGGARDEAVAVDAREWQRDADVRQDLVALDRRAQHDDRLVERVARRHVRTERVVHLASPWLTRRPVRSGPARSGRPVVIGLARAYDRTCGEAPQRGRGAAFRRPCQWRSAASGRPGQSRSVPRSTGS